MVTIERIRPDHAEALFRALRSPEIYRHLDEPPPADANAVARRIARWIAGPEAGAAEVWLNWAVRHEGVIVGHVQATVVGEEASLAWVFDPVVWGRGVAFAGVQAMIAALAERGVRRLRADTEVGNHRSRALMARLGFAEVSRTQTEVFFAREGLT